MNQEQFDYEYQKLNKTHIVNVKKRLDTDKNGVFSLLFDKFLSFLPILKWLPKYKINEYLFNDIIGGLTCGIMAIPQGMAYSSLAGVDPIYGLYSSFFAPFFYLFFGTSRHAAIGVFAVASMMVGNIVTNLISDESIIESSKDNVSQIQKVYHSTVIPFEFTPMTIISSLTFIVGIFQIIMALFRLSIVTTYMSDQLISGYTAGSAFHVFTSQLNKAIGVKTPHRAGVLMLPKMILDVILAIPNTNLITLIMSCIGLTFLFLSREYINPLFGKISRIPIPFELILVIIATIISGYFNFESLFNVSVVKHIPQGIPPPKLPDFRLIPYLWIDALSLSVICYMFVLSMAKLFAKKHKYKVDDNQELYALGFISILSSFFPVYPAGASLSRSSVCEMSGTKTQFYVVFTTLLLLIFIVFLGPLLEPLPMCILACIVIISLKGLFMQFRELPKLWRISKYDFMIWIVSCITTIFTDPSIGLLASFTFVIFSVILREQWPKVRKLYTNKEMDTFKDGSLYSGLLPVSEGVVVLKFESPLHFANCSRFKKKVSEVFEDDTFVMVVEKKDKKRNVILDDNLTSLVLRPTDPDHRLLIIDCSSVSYIDTMGAEAMCELRKSAADYNIELVFADIPESVLEVLKLKDFVDFLPPNALYPTVRAALRNAGIEKL